MKRHISIIKNIGNLIISIIFLVIFFMPERLETNTSQMLERINIIFIYMTVTVMFNSICHLLISNYKKINEMMKD